MKAKIKSVPITEVAERVQVLFGFTIYNVFKIESTESIWLRKPDGNLKLCNLKELKTLVVEYDDKTQQVAKQNTGEPVFVKLQLPLKYSQWQEVIDKGLVDSDKEVEVEIVEYNYKTRTEEPFGTFLPNREGIVVQRCAKLIP